MPPIQNKFNDILAKSSIELATRWISNPNENYSSNDIENWSTVEISKQNLKNYSKKSIFLKFIFLNNSLIKNQKLMMIS